MEGPRDQITLYDTLFDIVRHREEFAEVENRRNTISFHAFQEIKGHMVIGYDPDTRNVSIPWQQGNPDGYEKIVKIPKIVFNARLDKSPGLLDSLNEVAIKENKLFQLLDKQTKERIDGKRPTLLIGDDAFTFWIEAKELRHEHLPSVIINTRYFHDLGDHRHCEFVYDSQNRREAKISAEMETMPKHYLLVRLPNQTVLDPVGDTQFYPRKLSTAFTTRFPYKERVNAEIVPWTAQKIVEVVLRNRRMELRENAFGLKHKGRKI
ncbi:hypothetical protein [Pedobacter paludis]|nr:hypothetical protein [Pedobacter paludis]